MATINRAIPTRLCTISNGYWDNSRYVDDWDRVTFSGTYSRDTQSGSSGTVYVPLSNGTTTGSSGRDYSGHSEVSRHEFSFQCGTSDTYAGGGSLSISCSSRGWTASFVNKSIDSNGYASGFFKVTKIGNNQELPWVVSIAATGFREYSYQYGSNSTGVSGGYGIASVSTTTSYATVSASGQRVYANVNIPNYNASRHTYTVDFTPTVYSGYSSASDSASLTFTPDSALRVSGTAPTSTSGLYSSSPSVTWRESDREGSLAGDSVSCTYNFISYSYSNVWVDPVQENRADVRFTGQYANGATANNILADYVNFNGDVYPKN